MTLTELIASFRALSGDLTTPYLWLDDDLTIWLNEAESEAAIRKLLLFDNTTVAVTQIAVTATVAQYDLHESIIKVDHATLDDGTDTYQLQVISRARMNYMSDTWRTDVTRPDALIVDDAQCELNSAVDADYTMNLEVYRLPVTPISIVNETPEIAAVHHRFLVDWMLYRAFSKIDADAEDKRASAEALARFERYFGIRPQANTAKRVSVSQVTQSWW